MRRTTEHNLKIGLANKGKKRSLAIIKKMREVQSGSRGSNWKGGISKTYTLAYKEEVAGREKPKECELCGAIGIICFDHCHKTGKFRGWICRRCNLVLGHVKDSTDLLNILSNYIKKHESKMAM